jgi:hypothetical protein
MAIRGGMTSKRKRDAVRVAVVLALMGAVALAFRPTGTPRAPGGKYACDAVWIGKAGGHWDSARNWSTGKVPGATDRACVVPTASVVLDRGAHRVGSLEFGGRLQIDGGALELMDRTRTSELSDLVISHGILAVHGRLELAWHFYWGPGAHVAGPGEVDLGTASTTELVGGDSATLPGGAATPSKLAAGKLYDAPKVDDPPCGPYSPLASHASGTLDKKSIAAVRAVWAELAGIADGSGSPDRAAQLLAPGIGPRPVRPVPSTPAAKLAAARDSIATLRAWTRQYRPIERDLTDVIVVGDRAFAGTSHHGHIDFGHAGDGWRITAMKLRVQG